VLFVSSEFKLQSELYPQIDYQISVFATPAIDLIYALYFCVTPENRQKHRNELIAIYHEQFVKSLKAFGYLKTMPSLNEVQVEMLIKGKLEVLIAICISIFFIIDLGSFTAAEDFDMGEGTKRAKRRMYKESQKFREIIQKELSRFYYNGFI